MNGFLRGFAGVLAPLHRLFSASHSDVDASATPADGDGLTYVAATGKWTPQAPSGGSGGAWQLVYDHTVPMGGEDTWAIPLPAGDLRGVRYVLHFPTGGSGAAELAIDGIHVTELDPLLSQAGTWCLELVAIGAGVATGTVWYFQETGGASFFGPFGHQQGAALTTLDLTSFDASTPLVPADLPEDTTIEVWSLLA